MEKNTVKNTKKNKIISTQRYLQFASVHDDTLILKNGGIRAVLQISSVNFNLKSEEEQNSIIVSYQKFLNSLNFPVQILVRSQKLDIDHYLDDLKQKKKNLNNELLKKQMAEYIEYIQKLVEFTDIMEKNFYVVVPMNPQRAEKKSVLSSFLSKISPSDSVVDIITRKKEFKLLKKELDTKVNIVKTSLENCSLNVKQCSTQKIIELFYQSYNPQNSRIQKLSNLEDLAMEKI